MTTPASSTLSTRSSGSSAELMMAFEAFARPLFEESGIPGVSLAVLLPDGDHILNLGVTSVENPLPITSDTLFQIGSTTKTFTSLLISVLEAEGKLRVGDRVRDHLPEFKLKDDSAADDVTLLDLLSHQGGFQGDLFEDTGDGDDALAKVLDILAESRQVVPLRGHWSYNNAGFYVVGRVAEVVTGQTFEAAVTERIFKPLGMDHSMFSVNEIMTHRFATGHNKLEDKIEIQRPWLMMRSVGPAGSISSTVTDMLRYSHYILSGTLPPKPPAAQGAAPSTDGPPALDGYGKPIKVVPATESMLPKVDRPKLWSPVRPIGISMNGFPGTAGQMGQSWFNDRYPEATLISHGGTTLGQTSDYWLAPDQHVGFISLTNANTGHALGRKLSDWLKREVLGLTPQEHPVHIPAPGTLAEFTGSHERVGMSSKITVTQGGEGLILTLPDDLTGGTRSAPLSFITPDTALISDGELKGYAVEFLRNEQGSVDFIRVAGRLFPREVTEQAGVGPSA